jgi:hypothetical protein
VPKTGQIQDLRQRAQFMVDYRRTSFSWSHRRLGSPLLVLAKIALMKGREAHVWSKEPLQSPEVVLIGFDRSRAQILLSPFDVEFARLLERSIRGKWGKWSKHTR